MRRTTLPWWAHAADASAVALLFLAVFVAIEGGFVLVLGGQRISIRSEWRPLFWAGILLLARHVFVRHPPLHGRILAGFRAIGRGIGAAARAAGPLPEDFSPESGSTGPA